MTVTSTDALAFTHRARQTYHTVRWLECDLPRPLSWRRGKMAEFCRPFTVPWAQVGLHSSLKALDLGDASYSY